MSRESKVWNEDVVRKVDNLLRDPGVQQELIQKGIVRKPIDTNSKHNWGKVLIVLNCNSESFQGLSNYLTVKCPDLLKSEPYFQHPPHFYQNFMRCTQNYYNRTFFDTFASRNQFEMICDGIRHTVYCPLRRQNCSTLIFHPSYIDGIDRANRNKITRQDLSFLRWYPDYQKEDSSDNDDGDNDDDDNDDGDNDDDDDQVGDDQFGDDQVGDDQVGDDQVGDDHGSKKRGRINNGGSTNRRMKAKKASLNTGGKKSTGAKNKADKPTRGKKKRQALRKQRI